MRSGTSPVLEPSGTSPAPAPPPEGVPSPGPVRVLLAVVDPAKRDLVVRTLAAALPGATVAPADTRDGLVEALAGGPPDAVVTDFRLPGFAGLGLLDEVRRNDPDLPVVLLAETGAEDVAIDALRRGIDDYVIGSEAHIGRLPATLERAAERRRRRHVEIRQSEESYRNLFEGSLIGLTVVRPDGRIVVANAAFATMLGYDAPDELLALGQIDDVIAPYDRGRVTSYRSRRLAGAPAPPRYEFDVQRRNGSVATLETQVRVIRWHGETAVQGVVSDVTERIAAERALRESEARYRSVVDLSPDPILIHRDGVFVYANPAAVAQFRAGSSDRLVGRPVMGIVHPEMRETVAGRIENTLDEARIQQFDNERLVCLDGTGFVAEVRATTFEDESGRPTVQAVIRDVTARRRVEATLRRYQKMVASSGDLIALLGAEHRYLAVNEIYAGAFSLAPDRIVGRHVSDVVGEARYRSLVRPCLEKCFSGRRHHVQVWFDYPAIGRRYMDVRYDPYREEDGTVSGALVHVRDITALKEAEADARRSREQLRRLAAGLQAVREKERAAIAREIHDELGQTLTGLKLELAWLADRLPADSAVGRDRIDAMLSVVDDTVDAVRRISSSLRPPMLDDLGLAAAIEWMTTQFSERLGITCSVRVDDRDPGAAGDDEVAAFRIFQEALTNVARHAGARHIVVSLRYVDGALRLDVTDDGVGISDEALADSMSLGLLGMRERAAALGGHLDVERVPGAGTRVSLSLPGTARGAPRRDEDDDD